VVRVVGGGIEQGAQQDYGPQRRSEPDADHSGPQNTTGPESGVEPMAGSVAAPL